MFTTRFRTLMILGAAGAAAACAPVVGRHGFQPIDTQPADIVVGQDTRETVMTKLGSPSLVSTFEPNTWFYISQVTERYTYHKAEVSQRNVTEITFDPATQRVLEVNNLDLEDGQDVGMNGRVTPTRGRQLTILEQLLGNVGRQRLPGLEDDMVPGGQRPRD